MKTRAGVALLVAVAMALGSCDQESGPSRRFAGGKASPTPDRENGRPQGSERTAREREPTRPQSVPLRNLGQTRSDRRSIARAVRDLERLGFWPRLTRHVESVLVWTYPSPRRVPRDGRLAHALRKARLDRHGGYSCVVTIFSHALETDVARQEMYYAEGRLPYPAPSLRQFWAVILAHELAHCSGRGQRGERYSTLWERRVLTAYGTSRVGS